MLREGDERAKALLLLALLEMHQSKPMRVNMKEPEELEPMRKIDEIRRFSNKEHQRRIGVNIRKEVHGICERELQ